MSRGPAPYIQLGYVAGVHGVRGAIRVKLFNAKSSVLAPGVAIRLCPRDGDPAVSAAIAVERVAPKPGTDLWRLWLDGVDSREAADALRGRELWVARAELPDLDDDEFYLADLIGFEVVRRGGGGDDERNSEGIEALGEITGVTTNTAQELLCVRLAGDEWLLPALPPFIVELALDEGRVVVDVDDEMLPERRRGQA